MKIKFLLITFITGTALFSAPAFAQKVAAGNSYSISLCGDSTAMAWGDNFGGSLGNGSFTPSNVPVKVSLLTGIVAISARELHSVAVQQNGIVWNWGDTVLFAPVASQVSGITSPTAISAGGSHFLALKNDSTVWAWDRNPDGQLGTNSFNDSYTTAVQ